MTEVRKFLFLLGSAREGGNTEILARRAAEELPSGVEQRWLSLRDLPLPEFEDVRQLDGELVRAGKRSSFRCPS